MAAASELLELLSHARGSLAGLRVRPLGSLRMEEVRRREQFGPMPELRSQILRLEARRAIAQELLTDRPASELLEATLDAAQPLEDLPTDGLGVTEDELTEPGVAIEDADSLSAEDIEAALGSAEPDQAVAIDLVSDEPGADAAQVDPAVILHEPPPVRKPPTYQPDEPVLEPPPAQPDAPVLEDPPSPPEEPTLSPVTLDENQQLLGLDEDELGRLDELSVEDLEAEGLLDDESLDAELLGDEDSVDEGALLVADDEFPELPSGEIHLDEASDEPLAMADPDLEPTTFAQAVDPDETSEERQEREELEALLAQEEPPESVSVEPVSQEFDAIEAALFEDHSQEQPRSAAPPAVPEGEGHREDLRAAVLPTIKDRTAPRPIAAAAIQLKADGTAAMLNESEEDIQVEMPEADDSWEGDGAELGGFGIAYVDEVEYVEEPAEEPHAPTLSADGEANYQDGSLELTGDDISQVEQVDAAYIASLEARAGEALERGDLQAAAGAFSEILESDPANLEAHLGRGRCYMDLGDYAAAMSDFQKAEDLDPESPEALVAMGELFFARKEYTRAVEFFDQAIELDGQHAMARCRRGISYYYKKSYRQAFLDLQKAYTLDPEIPNIRKYVQMAIKKLERSGESA